MRLLSDDRKIRKYINENAYCPGNLRIAHYVRCKREGLEVPSKIDKFVTDGLEAILKAYNEGSKPPYDDIFDLKLKKGGNRISAATKLSEIWRIGSAIEDLIEAGLSYTNAIKKLQTDKKILGVTFNDAKVKKAYTAYKKL